MERLVRSIARIIEATPSVVRRSWARCQPADG
jgi:hypothetical protein